MGRIWQQICARRVVGLVLSTTVLGGWLLAPAALASAPLPGSNGTDTVLEASPASPVTNQAVTLAATVTSAIGAPFPSGTVAFTNGGAAIGGCGGVPVAGIAQSVTVVCSTSFGAGTPGLVAVFTPSAGSYLNGSVSPTDSLSVLPQSSSTSLDVSSHVNVGIGTTFTASVSAPSSGPLEPTGAVEFYDGDRPIGSCLSQPLMAGAATCTVRYPAAGAHAVTARYLGDANFTGSSSPIAYVTVTRRPAGVPGTITSTMQWTFAYTPSYTDVRALVINAVPAGTTVLVECEGPGCPFAGRALGPANKKRCDPRTRRMCWERGTVDLTPGFGRHRLAAGARITVAIVRPAWIGKYYSFTMRDRRGPRIRIACLAPGEDRPGGSC